MLGNISLENSNIPVSNKILLFTTIVSAISLYMFTPNFALTIDDDQKPKKHLGIIFSTSLLLGFSAALFYLLQFVRNSKPSSEENFQKLDRRTIVGNYYI